MAKKPRDGAGRSKSPEAPVACPVCGIIVGRRGLSRHMVALHGTPQDEALAASREAKLVRPSGRDLDALLDEAVRILQKLEALPMMELDASVEADVRGQLSTRLADLRAQIGSRAGPSP